MGSRSRSAFLSRLSTLTVEVRVREDLPGRCLWPPFQGKAVSSEVTEVGVPGLGLHEPACTSPGAAEQPMFSSDMGGNSPAEGLIEPCTWV